MSHDYHEGLPGFDERQILHDGCRECEERSKNVDVAIDHMDATTFLEAWLRAADWQAHSLVENPDSSLTRPRAEHLSRAELPVLRALWSVQVQLERHGSFVRLAHSDRP